MNSLVCIWVPTTSWAQGARGQCGSKLNLAPITPLTLLLSLPSLPPHWTSLPMSSEQLSMYLGPNHLWGQGARGQGGSKLKLAPLTPKSLLSLPSLPACCTSLPMSNEQLTMYWGLHYLWEQEARGQHWSKLKLAPLTPRSLPLLPPCSSSLQLTPSFQLTPACSQLAPAHSQLAPSSLQLTPNGHVCVGVPTTSGV